MNVLKKALLYIYNAWCLFWFIGILLILFPFIYISIQRKQWHPVGHKLTQLWAKALFFIIGKPLRVIRDFNPEPNGTYVYVANHFSYLDVAVGVALFKNDFSYVGKSSVKKMPLVGYMFQKLHIMVDRNDKNSRSNSLSRGMKSLKEGKSIFIMPEGGILSKNIPQMLHPFKDGAFSMAIANNVPIVPISFTNMYKIMPELMIRGGIPRIVIHPPIMTTNKSRADIESLKQEAYETIQTSIDNYRNV